MFLAVLNFILLKQPRYVLTLDYSDCSLLCCMTWSITFLITKGFAGDPRPIIGNFVRYHILDEGHSSGREMRLLVMRPGLRFKFKLVGVCLGIQELRKQGRPQEK